MDVGHVLGISITGFLFLAGWMMAIQVKVSMIEIMSKDLKEIKLGLLGDMDKKGLITKVHDTDVRLDAIEKVCKERHNK